MPELNTLRIDPDAGNPRAAHRLLNRPKKRNTDDFMRLWRSAKPTIAKLHGYAAAGDSDSGQPIPEGDEARALVHAMGRKRNQDN